VNNCVSIKRTRSGRPDSSAARSIGLGSRRSTGEVTRDHPAARSAVHGPRSWDALLIASVMIMLGLGIVLVYSSSSVFAARIHGDAEYFLKAQLGWAVLGLIGMVMAAHVPGEWLQKRAGLLFLGCVVLCVLVLIPGIGHLANGARRWITFAGVGFQPSELTKVAVVVAIAGILANRDANMKKDRSSLLVPVLIAQIPVALILKEPDLGTALVIELVVAVMVFSAGLRLRTLALVGLTALPVFYNQLMGTRWRIERILAWIDPWAYRSTTGYQVSESLISIGSGGLWGVGLGASKHKLFFLPAAHTDFIFALLAEELGFIGVMVVLCVVALFVARALRAAVGAVSSFDGYLAVGLGALVAVPAVFNMCVASGMLPTKGLPLPLVSYGGSNLLATLVAVGLLLRVARDGIAEESTK